MPNRLLLRLRPTKVYWLPFLIGQISGILAVYYAISDFGKSYTLVLNKPVLFAIPMAGLIWLFLKAIIRTQWVNIISIAIGIVLITIWLVRNDGVYELIAIAFTPGALENIIALMGIVLFATATFDLAYFSQNLILYTLIVGIVYQLEPVLIKIDGYIFSKFRALILGITIPITYPLVFVICIEFFILIWGEIKRQQGSRKI